MPNSIALTASMRSNLMSLKNIASQMDKTQNILSTGKKVNSAIDNASSYYQSRSLTSRAGDLSSLLDTMGQGIQTLQAANEGIESATSYLEQARSVIEQASAIEEHNFSSKVELKNDDVEALVAQGYTKISKGMSAYSIKSLINSKGDNAKFVLEDDIKLSDYLTIYNSGVVINGAGHKLIGGSYGIEMMGDGDVTLENMVLDNNGSHIYFEVGGLTLKNVEVQFKDNDASAIISNTAGGINLENVDFNVENSNSQFSVINSTDDINIKNTVVNILTDEANNVTCVKTNKNVTVDGMLITGNCDTGISANQIQGVADGSVDTINKEFSGVDADFYAEEFNAIITEYDNLVKDTSYQGVNLLTGGEMKVTFNETRTHDFLVKGEDIRSDKVGLKQAEWKNKDQINASMDEVQNVIGKLRSLATDLGNKYQVIQTRQSFTGALCDVLETGADDLVLADMNEASAEYLMLQTRQQLAVNSLSLASQSASSILSLF
ncbi:MAG: hypothetical protein E7004_03205 [Alphaproteobacteria bacterium]|nr:hypothetical protein [Alphaproteobacteria bacterium]